MGERGRERRRGKVAVESFVNARALVCLYNYARSLLQASRTDTVVNN